LKIDGNFDLVTNVQEEFALLFLVFILCFSYFESIHSSQILQSFQCQISGFMAMWENMSGKKSGMKSAALELRSMFGLT
jgi:hypothetical protein